MKNCSNTSINNLEVNKENKRWLQSVLFGRRQIEGNWLPFTLESSRAKQKSTIYKNVVLRIYCYEGGFGYVKS